MTGESGCRRIYPWPDSTTNVLGQNLRPRLTTIHQDPSQKARLAFGMLRGIIAGERREGEIVRLPVSLVIGGTTAPPRV